MARRTKSGLSYSNVVATLALIVAISGGATAIALTVGKNTVTTKSIKPGNVTARDLGPIETVIKQQSLPAGAGVVRVFCPPKSRALSGGGVGAAELESSYPVPGGWEVGFSGGTGLVSAYVVCLSDKTGKPQNR